jgi:uncharacterized coiled-coil protein SlyX
MSQSSLERVWRSLVAVDHFLRHELAPLLENSTVVDPQQWTPIFAAARILDEERAFVPAEVYRTGKAAVVSYLERELNLMIDRLRDLIDVRAAGGDEVAALDAVRVQLQRAVAGYGEQLEPVRLAVEAARSAPAATTGATHIAIGSISGVSGQMFLGQFGQAQAQQGVAQQELLDALGGLNEALAASQQLSAQAKAELATLVEQLGQQARQPQPNRTLAKALGDGLLATLKAVPDVAKAATTLGPLLTRWLG